MSFSPFSHTSKQFAALLHERCGRGLQQAEALYTCFMRYGCIHENLPAFKNAPQLYREMVLLINTNILSHEVVGEEQGTIRFVLCTHDGCRIESVLMNMHHGYTLCVSSQIGCRMGCSFCCTGQSGFVRNLSCSEIVQQLFVAQHTLKKDVKNIVFMGMGEPFDTKEAVFHAIDILADPLGLGIGMKHITISTSGDIQGILSMAAHTGSGPNLAVSLNAASDEKRSFLMPYRKEEPLSELRKALLTYNSMRKKEILVSYVLLKEVNDSPLERQLLCSFLENISAKINLIPFNFFPGALHEASEMRVVEDWLSCLRNKGFRVLLRGRKGGTIGAACGQLQRKY